MVTAMSTMDCLGSMSSRSNSFSTCRQRARRHLFPNKSILEFHNMSLASHDMQGCMKMRKQDKRSYSLVHILNAFNSAGLLCCCRWHVQVDLPTQRAPSHLPRTHTLGTVPREHLGAPSEHSKVDCFLRVSETAPLTATRTSFALNVILQHKALPSAARCENATQEAVGRFLGVQQPGCARARRLSRPQPMQTNPCWFPPSTSAARHKFLDHIIPSKGLLMVCRFSAWVMRSCFI